MQFENEEQLRKCLKEKFPYEEMSDEELKTRFIDSFGEEKWHEIEVLSELDNLNFKLCDFLGIDSIAVIFEEMEEDARYYDQLDYIAISNKFVHDEMECKKSLIHEVRHLYQKYCISHKNENHILSTDYLIKHWEADFKKNQRLIPPDKLMCMPVEVDAFAFTKYILKNWFNYDYHHYDETFDCLLDLYINKYFK